MRWSHRGRKRPKAQAWCLESPPGSSRPAGKPPKIRFATIGAPVGFPLPRWRLLYPGVIRCSQPEEPGMSLALVHPAALGPSATKGSEVIPIGSTAPHPFKRISPLEPAPPRQTQRSRALRPPGVPSPLKANLFCSRTFPSGTLPKLHDNRYLGNEARYMSE